MNHSNKPTLIQALQQGFTLIEVMIAVSVFSISAAAIVMANMQSLNSAYKIEAQIQARWVAEQLLAEMRLKTELPDNGNHNLDREHNGQSWTIDYEVTATTNEQFKDRFKHIEFKTKRKNESNYDDIFIAYIGR